MNIWGTSGLIVLSLHHPPGDPLSMELQTQKNMIIICKQMPACAGYIPHARVMFWVKDLQGL